MVEIRLLNQSTLKNLLKGIGDIPGHIIREFVGSSLFLDLWCSGSTNDFGSFSIGSNPVKSTTWCYYTSG